MRATILRHGWHAFGGALLSEWDYGGSGGWAADWEEPSGAYYAADAG